MQGLLADRVQLVPPVPQDGGVTMDPLDLQDLLDLLVPPMVAGAAGVLQAVLGPRDPQAYVPHQQ